MKTKRVTGLQKVLRIVFFLALVPLESAGVTSDSTPDTETLAFDQHFKEGVDLLDKAEFEAAIEAFQEALTVDATVASVYNNLCVCYAQVGKHQEALASCHEAIEIDPGFARAYYNRGIVYCMLEQLYDAVKSYKKAITLDPDEIDFYNRLGTTYYSMGQRHKAIEIFMNAIELDPGDVRLYNNLAVVYKSMRDYKRAKKNLRKIKEIYQAEDNRQGVREVERYLDTFP